MALTPGGNSRGVLGPRRLLAPLILAVLAVLVVAPAALAGFARDGRYTGRTNQTLQGKRGLVAFSIGHDGNRMASIRVNLLYHCVKLGRYATTLRVRGTFVGKHAGSFLQQGSFHTTGPRGRAARVAVTFRGRFSSHRYARGAVEAVMAVLRAGKVVDRCAVRTSFSAQRR